MKSKEFSTTRLARNVGIALLGLTTTVSGSATALPESTRREVEYLLQYIEDSGCAFNRNGNWYDGRQARSHIESKYNYLLKNHSIATTEDFISKAASESSISGEPYLVQCPGEDPLVSARWLEKQLAELRQKMP